MNLAFIRQFRLSPPGKGRGISCDGNGTFVGPVPLLKRRHVNGKEIWEPRDGSELSDALAERYGLPIDVSSKARGLASIARALNEGAIARAQLGTLHLQFPDPPPLAKVSSRDELIKFIRELAGSGLLKANWDPTKHPRWSAGTPDSKGGKFAPKGTESAEPGIGHNGGPPLEAEEAPAAETGLAEELATASLLAVPILLATTASAGSTDEDAAMEKFHRHHSWPKYLGGAINQALTRLPAKLHMQLHAELDKVAPRTAGTEYYEKMSPEQRMATVRKITRVFKKFDVDHATHLYDDAVSNGLPVVE